MAQTDTWLDGSGNWDNPTKWSQGKKPSYIVDPNSSFDTGPENAVIGGSATETITVSGNETDSNGVRSLTLNNYNASLVITGALDVGAIGGADAPCYLNVQNGSLIVDGGTLTVLPGSVPSNAPTLAYRTNAYGTVYLQNYGSYNWNSTGSAAGQTIAFQGSGSVTLNAAYNGKIVGFGSGDAVYIYGSSAGAFNIKNVTYGGIFSGNQATITYTDNSTSTLQFSVNTYLNISVSGGAAYIYGVADPNPPPQPSFFLQGLDGDGYANAQQPLSFQYFGANQPTFTWSEKVGGQAIVLEKGGEEAYAYTPTAADAGQEIDVTINYYDSHGVYQTQTFSAAVNSLPPTVTAPGTLTNKARPAISGTGEIGNTVKLTIDGNAIDTSSKPIIVKNDGTWSYTPSSNFSDGKHNVSATQIGYAKASDPSNTDYFTVDTTAPVIQSVTLDNTTYGLGSTVTAKIQLTTPYDGNGDYTLGSGSKIDGMTLTGGTFTAVNDYLYATFQVDGTTKEVTNGSVDTYITVNDAAGNTSAVYNTGITGETIDRTAPSLASASVTGNQLVLTYSETGAGLNGADLPAAPQFVVNDGGNSVPVTYVAYDAANKTVTLTLQNAVANGDTVTASYSPAAASSQNIQDAAGNLAASFSNQAVTNNTPAALPMIAITTPIAGDNVINLAEATAGVTIAGTSSVGPGQFVVVTLLHDSSSAGNYGTYTNADGSWSVFVQQKTTPLVDGDYTVTADVRDSSGDRAPQASQAISVDLTRPDAPTSLVLAPGQDTGVSSTDGITSVNTFNLTGTADAGLTINLYRDAGVLLGTTTVANDGTYAFTSPVIADGLHSLYTATVDAAGNRSGASNLIKVTVDTAPPAPPAAPTLSPASDTGVQSDDHTTIARPTVTGTAEAGSTVTLYDSDGTTVLGTAVASSSGKYAITSTTLSIGVHRLTVTSTDKAGNHISSGANNVTIDQLELPSAPDMTARSDSGASSTDDLTNVKTPTFTGTTVANATVQLYEGNKLRGTGRADANGVYSVTSSTLGDGSHTLQVRATDPYGNVSNLSNGTVIKIDTSAPAAPSSPALTMASDTGTSSSDGITSNATPTVTGTAQAGSTVTLYRDGGIVVGSMTLAANATAYSFTTPTLTDGLHSLYARATDAAGNLSATSALRKVTIDTQAPNVAINGVDRTVNSASQTISGTGEAGTTVTLTDNGNAIGTTKVASNGTWSKAVTLSTGQNKFVATDTDTAGNVGTSSAVTVTYTVGSAMRSLHSMVQAMATAMPTSSSALTPSAMAVHADMHLAVAHG